MWVALAFVLVAFIPVSWVSVISVLNTRSEAVNPFMDGSSAQGDSVRLSHLSSGLNGLVGRFKS